MRSTWFCTLGLLAATSAMTAGGCVGPSRSVQPHPQVSSSATRTASEGAARLAPEAVDLLSGVPYDAADSNPLSVLVDDRVESCMKKAGLPYRAVHPAASGDRVVDGVDLTVRATDGYGIWKQYPGSVDQADSVPANLHGERLEKWQEALYGSPDRLRKMTLADGSAIGYPVDGCLAEARLDLAAGDLEGYLRLTYDPQAIRNLLIPQIRESAPYRNRVQAWSACMLGKNLTYASPEAAYESLRARYAKSGVTPELRSIEKRIATADGTCVIRVGLARIRTALMNEFASRLPRQRIEELNALAVLRAEVMTRAEAGTAEPPR